MPRVARRVIPSVPHHVIQRGNRQQPIFFSDLDRRVYLDLLASALGAAGTKCLAWCLMDNHVHLILVPKTEDGLRQPLARTHTSYSQRINRRMGLTGHLFQGRFQSYPMDDRHLMVAVRYVENNPVAAGMVGRAEDWQWSSARAHVFQLDDGLTNVAELGRHVANWRAMLTGGLEAADATRIDAALVSGALDVPRRQAGRRSKIGDSPRIKLGTVPD